MTKLFSLLSLLIIAVFITSSKNNNNDLEYFISNKFVKDSTDVVVTLKNNSSRNYYLLLDTLQFNDDYDKFNLSKSIMWSTLKISDVKGEHPRLQIEDYDCQSDSLYRKKKGISTKSFLKINTRESITFKVPFKIKTSINNYYWQKYLLEQPINKSYYKIYFESLPVEEWESQNSFKVAQDSLRKMGYELYNNKISSNEVPLIVR